MPIPKRLKGTLLSTLSILVNFAVFSGVTSCIVDIYRLLTKHLTLMYNRYIISPVIRA